MVFTHIEMCIGKMSWFVHNFLQNHHLVPKVYVLSCSYLDCLGYFIVYIVCPNCTLVALTDTRTLVTPPSNRGEARLANADAIVANGVSVVVTLCTRLRATVVSSSSIWFKSTKAISS